MNVLFSMLFAVLLTSADDNILPSSKVSGCECTGMIASHYAGLRVTKQNGESSYFDLMPMTNFNWEAHLQNCLKTVEKLQSVGFCPSN